MADVLEIEMKYVLSEQNLQKLMAYINQTGFDLAGKHHEVDEYYSRPDVDFMKTKECLRIRKTKDYSELTYKPGTSTTMKKAGFFWKKEVNIDITGQETAVEEMLNNLGMQQLVVVDKRRVKYVKSEVNICIDYVKDAGQFVEFEILADQSGLDKAKNILKDLAKDFDFSDDDLVKLPYRDIVMRVSA